MNDLTISKFLSLVLRHKPEEIGLTLDDGGWADIDDLIRLAAANGTEITRERLATIVAGSDKQRFAISECGRRIRANQGHSVQVSLGLTPLEPPEYLFHGTATRFLEVVRIEGLLKRGRQYVHLSTDEIGARAVGQRHGAPVVLLVSAQAMFAGGHLFYRSENGVWLTEHVPARFLKVWEK